MNVFDHCKDKKNAGISIWIIKKQRAFFLCGNLKTIPNFDSNQTYLVISFQYLSILNDQFIKMLDTFYWVGSKSENYDISYQIVQ